MSYQTQSPKTPPTKTPELIKEKLRVAQENLNAIRGNPDAIKAELDASADELAAIEYELKAMPDIPEPITKDLRKITDRVYDIAIAMGSISVEPDEAEEFETELTAFQDELEEIDGTLERIRRQL